jgi:molybdate transport system regulatory protein
MRGLHDHATAGDAVQVRVGADAVTVYSEDADIDPDATSARNRLQGTVVDVDAGETVCTVRVAVKGTAFHVLVTAESASRLALTEGDDVSVRWKATATRLVRHATTAGSAEPSRD